MPALTKFQPFVENLGRKAFNLHTDTLKWMLTNVQPQVGWATKSQITEIAAGNGYLAGGIAVPNNSYVQAGGVAKLNGDDVSITATTGTIGPFQWAVLYSDTAANDELIGFTDYGSPQTLQIGEAVQFDVDQVNGILQNT